MKRSFIFMKILPKKLKKMQSHIKIMKRLIINLSQTKFINQRKGNYLIVKIFFLNLCVFHRKIFVVNFIRKLGWSTQLRLCIFQSQSTKHFKYHHTLLLN